VAHRPVVGPHWFKQSHSKRYFETVQTTELMLHYFWFTMFITNLFRIAQWYYLQDRT